MKHNGIELDLLCDDGNGNRLWIEKESQKVANERYDATTGDSCGLDDNIEGWGYSEEDSLV